MFKSIVTGELAKAGIEIGGRKPHDIRVRDPRFFRRAALLGSLGVGDGYADGDLECDDIGAFVLRWMERGTKSAIERPPRFNWPSSLPEAWIRLRLLTSNQQSIVRSKRVGERHYDIGNELYERMLGPTMAYSCGYWTRSTSSGQEVAKTLDEAQRGKYRRICDKLNLKPGMRVLEIGCGWGGFAAYAADEYGATVVGVSISREQIAYAQEKYKPLVESGRLDLRFLDYRDIPKAFPERFDAVVSIGMFEHVGPRNYDEYMRIAHACLKPGRPFLLHTIVGNGGVDPFIWHRIFVGGILPTETQIAKAARRYFTIEHVENFGYDYYRTLTAWWQNFSQHWQDIRVSGRYDERFYRLWEFYLKSCAMAFKVRRIQLEQWVLVPGGTEGGYTLRA